MKQGIYRVSTNQTSISNKKSSKSKIQSNNNKYTDNQHSQSFQLPKIHRISNNDTTSNRSYDLSLTAQQKALTHNQRLSNIQQSDKQQTLGVVDYENMTMQQIKRQYERLRKEFNILNVQIRRSQELLMSRVTNKKSRVSSTGETQKLLAKAQLQIYQNSLLLQKLRLQCQQLDKRSTLANSNISKPNAELNEKLVKVKQKLLSTKEKIKLLRKKTKKSGEDIMNVEDVHELAQKLQKQNKNYELKLSSLQSKLEESRYKIQRQDEKLSQIHNSYNDAQNYLKLFKLQNDEQAERGVVEKQYQQLRYKHEVIRKKIQSDQQTNLQKYHQLLKLLQTQNQKEEILSKKLIQEDVNILKARNVQLELQQQLQQLQEIITKFKQQQLIKKQASLLRKAIQSSSNITYTNNNNIILEENQSQINDTIQAARHNDNIQSSTNDKEDDDNGTDQLMIKGNQIKQEGQMGTKGYADSNSVNMRVNANSNSFLKDSKVKEHVIPQKQFAKRKNQQLKGAIISNNKKHQQPPTSIVMKSGRKIHSVMQTKHQPYLNSRLNQPFPSNGNPDIQSQNQGDAVSGKKMPSIDELQQRSSSKVSLGNNKPLRNSSNNNNNKSSLSNNNDDMNDEFIRQLEKLNQQLIYQGDSNSNNQQLVQVNAKTYKQINTKSSQQSSAMISQQSSAMPSKQKISPRVPHSIVSPKSRVESTNKQGKIRKQHSNILKPQMLQQIDKTNIEYSKKISQLRKQIQVQQIANPTTNKGDRNDNQQQQQQQQQQQHQQPQKPTQNPNPLQQSQQHPHQQTLSEQISDSDLDEDIDNDIEEINNMVRNKLNQ